MNRRTDRKLTTRADILAAARGLFAERGWDGTTTKLVAEAAGVAVGTVFLHFPDKTALLEAASRAQVAAALEQAQATIPGVGLLPQLTHLAGTLYTMYARDRALSRVLVKESLFLVDGAAAAAARAQVEQLSHHVAALIDAARIRGEVDRTVDPRLGAAVFVSLYFAVLTGGLRDGLAVTAQLDLLRAMLDQYYNPRKKA